MYQTSRYLRKGYILSNYCNRLLSTKKPVVDLTPGLKVHQLAVKLKTSNNAVSRILKNVGQKNVVNSTSLSLELSKMVAIEMGFTPNEQNTANTKHITVQTKPPLINLKPRPPVVTVMGHVDHGKTSLLDAIRSTSVAKTEAGGITQHIGAFSVPLANGKSITFLDTPGHAAFTNMRSRGANVTDIIILVVAADDGVMPQTIESIKMAQKAAVPIVVAINKCDKHKKDIPKVKQQLLQYGIQLEEYGGDTQAVELSAITGDGIDTLEESVIAQAEMCNLMADPCSPVEGVVIESRTDKGLGHTATVLIQQGTLQCGCILVSGEGWGKVRALINESGKNIKQATPSIPVLTTGWRELPEAGLKCIEVNKESEATQIINRRKGINKKKQESLKRKSTTPANDTIVVPLIVKGDVSGSVEALIGIIQSKQPDQIKLTVIHTGVGGVSDSDIDMASSVGGIILAFNVTSTKSTTKLAIQNDVTIISHNVIYKLVETFADHLEGLLPKVIEDEIIGEAVVLQVFQLRGSKKNRAVIGGCRVKKGKLIKDSLYQIWREDTLVFEGTLIGMKRGKEDIVTAKKETECGLNCKNNDDWKEEDKVVCLKKTKTSQKLNWNIGF